MNLQDLQQMARQAGVFDKLAYTEYGFRSEPQLIRAIQRARGEEDCFRTDQRYLCKKCQCRWREDCLKLVARWQD